MEDISYIKKVVELRKSHGFDSQVFLPSYVDMLEKEIIAAQENQAAQTTNKLSEKLCDFCADTSEADNIICDRCLDRLIREGA